MKRLLALACIWGWSFLLIKVAVRGMTPATVAAGRIGLGALVLVGIVRRRRLAMPQGWEWWRHFVVVALAGSAFPFTLLAWGEQHVSSALTAVLNASTPLFAAVMAFFLVGDRLTRAQAVGLAVGFVGVAVTAGLALSDLAGSSLGGELASVAAGAGYGLSFAYTRRHLTSFPPVVAAASQLLVATVLLAPVAVVTSVRLGLPLGWRPALSVTLLGVVGTGLAYVLSYRLIADLGPTRASVVTYVIPVVAVTVGVVFLHEEFSLRLLAGGALVLAGVVLLNCGNWTTPAAVQSPHEDESEVGDASDGDRGGRGDGAAGGGGSGRVEDRYGPRRQRPHR